MPSLIIKSPRRSLMITVGLSLLAVALLSVAALADDATPLFPQDRICAAAPPAPGAPPPGAEATLAAPASAVSPDRLLQFLLDENPIRDGVLDANKDTDTLASEKILALSRPDYCTAVAKDCTPEDEAALAKARDRLLTFITAGGGPGYEIEQLGAGPGTPTPADILDPDGRAVRITCVALPTPVAVEESYWHLNAAQGGGFRLTGDIDNLSKNRGSLGAVRAAELSITSDLIEDETAYKVIAVAGYAFEAKGGDELETSFIPFLQVEHITAGEDTKVDTLGAGFTQAMRVNWPGALRSEFAVTPLYTTDSDFESHTGQLKFRWTPTLEKNPLFPLGFPEVYGPVEMRFGLDFLADVGRVFDEGDEDNLDGEDNFIRFGNQASLQMRGAPGNLLRQIEVQLNNRFLYNVDTEFETINQFDAALAYLFPGNENFQLSFAYSNGRDDNSLELYEFWQTQFGVRF